MVHNTNQCDNGKKKSMNFNNNVYFRISLEMDINWVSIIVANLSSIAVQFHNYTIFLRYLLHE